MISYLTIYENLTKASNLDELWQRMMSLQSNFGISSGYYGARYCKESAAEHGISNSMWTIGDHPQEFTDHFGGEEFINADVTAIHCMTKTTPFIWHQFERYDGITEEQRQYMEGGAQFDMNVGVTIPVRFKQVGGGGMGLASKDLDSKEFMKVWDSHQHEILTITNVFDELTRTEHINEIFNLTAREKDILTWLANGITIQQIAYKLKRKPSTIETQLRGARQKLEARNNVQAITKAMLFNLINP